MTVNHGVLGSSPCSGAFWEFSSAGSEHLPYKQRVGGSNPSTPTEDTEQTTFSRLFLFCVYGRVQALAIAPKQNPADGGCSVW